MSNVAAVKGIVQQLKEKQTAYGTMYDLQVNGTWYGAGKKHPGVRQGDTAEFAATLKDGKYWNVMGNVSKAEVQETVTRAPDAVPSASPPKSVQWQPSYQPQQDTRHNTISFQAARNAAIEFLGVMQAAGAMPFSDTATKAAKQNKQTALEGLLDHYTELFYNDTLNLGERFMDKEAVVEQDGEWTT